MWNWFNCYLSGRHEYVKWCEGGEVYLRCLHCEKRSPGFSIDPKAVMRSDAAGKPTLVVGASKERGRVIPFGRAAAG